MGAFFAVLSPSILFADNFSELVDSLDTVHRSRRSPKVQFPFPAGWQSVGSAVCNIVWIRVTTRPSPNDVYGVDNHVGALSCIVTFLKDARERLVDETLCAPA